MAVKGYLKFNEYGLFSGDERLAGETEEEVYRRFDLAYVEPELRENRGEIEAARSGELPDLASESDIRGNLHAYTDFTDGHAGLEEGACGARGRPVKSSSIRTLTQIARYPQSARLAPPLLYPSKDIYLALPERLDSELREQ